MLMSPMGHVEGAKVDVRFTAERTSRGSRFLHSTTDIETDIVGSVKVPIADVVENIASLQAQY
jgi:hypothetical protein